MNGFCHLHTHTQYSLLDGASRIENLILKAKKNKMPALAITDHGNMFGVPEFVAVAQKEKIKPLIGCEFYLAPESRFDKKAKVIDAEQDKKNFYHQLLLAKNPKGYKNLSRLCSLGFIEGFYYKPRIDKELITKYRDGLIATTTCLASEINQTIVKRGEAEAENYFRWWYEMFGDDFYIEIQRHDIEEQNVCNKILLKWAKKYNVQIIATNDIHYVEMSDAEAQDILLCIQTGKDRDDPKRLKFDNDQFYMKTTEEMSKNFSDIPQALENTIEVVSKIEDINLKKDILLPVYQLPPDFSTENEYLKHLTYLGAKARYDVLTDEQTKRLEFELEVISRMGFAGYFLIVADFVKAAKELNVKVGPGRGSAAGSIIAFCLGITNIDPIKYDLLFERFLNPDRISMPDIDIDFDEKGREKVIEYVVKKYGKNQVAQIITYGTMAPRLAIRDVSRIMKVKLEDADYLAKLVPERPGITLPEAYKESAELKKVKDGKNAIFSKTLELAEKLEGSPRHTSLHAAGIIIAPSDIIEHVPICTSKDSELFVTQYEHKFLESSGMLKMDFLGLKTLNIIEDSLLLIKKNYGVEIDIDKIPLDDPRTFELYQRAETIGTFQFESEPMRKHLSALKPTNVEDLIAMNALYRPGPMDSIPEYIRRKNGLEKTDFTHPLIEPFLKSTYGVIVYQEQVMKISQTLAGFTKGEADVLRKAMSKRDKPKLESMREKFIKGCGENKIPNKIAEDLFGRMVKFGEYGFNRSHSAAYSVLAYQTGYLKANYLSEYMSSVLTWNMSSIEKIAFFLDECKALKVETLGPDINESDYKFIAKPTKEIRYGLGAIKGAGETAITEIVKERELNGPFSDYFDFVKRVNQKAVNKKCIDCLAYAGAFDCFKEIHRAQYFFIAPGEEQNFIEKSIQYGNSVKAQKNQKHFNLFGEKNLYDAPPPTPPSCPPFDRLTKLKFEKDYIGFYFSGHPLDEFIREISIFCNCKSNEFERFQNREVSLAGLVTKVAVKTDKNGNSFGIYELEDYKGHFSIMLFNEDYLKIGHYFVPGKLLWMKGKSQLRYKTANYWEFRPYQVYLLQEILQKLTRIVKVKVSYKSITNNSIEKIESILTRFPGKCPLKINLIDSQ